MSRPYPEPGLHPMRSKRTKPVICCACSLPIDNPTFSQKPSTKFPAHGKVSCQKIAREKRNAATAKKRANAAKFKKTRRAWRQTKKIWPERNLKYRAFIRRQSCCVPNCVCKDPYSMLTKCQRRVEHAHMGAHAQAQKSSDTRGLPLCRWMHQEAPNAYHKRARGWLERMGIDHEAEVKRLNALFVASGGVE